MGSSNFLAWASSVELWCKGQGIQDHLTNNAYVVDEKADASEEYGKAKTLWEKVDAQLCSLLWRSIASNLMPCFSLYNNDISRFYDVISRMTNLKK